MSKSKSKYQGLLHPAEKWSAFRFNNPAEVEKQLGKWAYAVMQRSGSIVLSLRGGSVSWRIKKAHEGDWFYIIASSKRPISKKERSRVEAHVWDEQYVPFRLRPIKPKNNPA
jgi:hypothetical protein